jgi:hypothetical protein
MLAALYGLLASLPKLLQILEWIGQSLLSLVQSVRDSHDIKVEKEANKKAGETGDTTDLENSFGHKK